MKKILALVLAIVMMASMSVVAFAAADAVESAGNDDVVYSDQKVQVSYTTSKGYTVVIPANFAIDAGTKTGSTSFQLTSANLAGGEVLTVSVDGENEAIDETWLWSLVDSKADGTKADPVGYNIGVAGAGVTSEKIEQGAAILTYTSSADAFSPMTAALSLTANATNQVATFVDYLTFSVAIN